MKLLAIDTTEIACSAALLIEDEMLERFEVAPRRHSELVLPMMEAVLQASGLRLDALDALAFARGPGSFTGVRIATAIVQGAAFGAELPVIPVSSLQALAQGCYRRDGAKAVLTALDARMNEVYWGAFRADDGGLVRPVISETVLTAADVAVPTGDDWTGAGSGWGPYREALAARCVNRLAAVDAEAQIHAGDVARLAVERFDQGGAVPAEQALPVYLRDQVAVKRS